jgi:predicted transcriptional regulator
MLTIPQPLSNIQMELLKVYSSSVPDEWLPEIREMLARYMLEKARDEADKIWKEKGYSEKTIKTWLKTNPK